MENQKVFSAIKSFVIEIKNNYGNEYKPLALYGRLIEKTEVSNEVPVQKHISTFRKFVINNRDGILNKDESLFKVQKVKYNDNVYFNIAHVLKMADNESKTGMWEHLLVLSALLDKNSDAKNQLMLSRTQSQQQQPNVLMPMMSMLTNMLMGDMMNGGSGSGGSENPLGGLASLLGGVGEGSGGGTPDLGKILSTLMNSDMLTKLTSTFSNSLSDGKLDLNMLLQSLGEVSEDMNLGINVPKDASELKNGVDDVLKMFGSVGISEEQMNDMVEKISSTLDSASAEVPSETSDITDESNVEVPLESGDITEESGSSTVEPSVVVSTTPLLVDNTNVEIKSGAQVCYLDGHCE